MKKKILPITSFFLILSLSSIGVSAISKDTLSELQQRNYTGIWADKDLQDETYYKDGVQQFNTWFKDDIGKWYYFGSNGIPVRGWNKIDGKWYFFKSDRGIMAVNSTIEGKYYVGADGSWIQ